jgi:hypothetical protein
MLGIVLVFLAVLVPAPASTGPAFAPDCPIFPANNVWHADISRLPVHPSSGDWISSMGARFRLKAGFDISGFRPDTRVILRAMKEHGLIVADNGSNWFFGGTAEEGWNNAMLDELKTIPAGQFEAVDASSLMVDPDSGRAAGGSPCTSTGSGTIFGTAGSDVLCGSGDDDTIKGLGGDNVRPERVRLRRHSGRLRLGEPAVRWRRGGRAPREVCRRHAGGRPWVR